MIYTTIFDAANYPIRHWTFLVPGLVGTTVGALMVFRPNVLKSIDFRGADSKFRLPLGWFFLVFSTFWTLIAGGSVIVGSMNAARNARSESCNVVEGVVENYWTGPVPNKGAESFSVKGIRFEYSDFILEPGFNNSAFYGGPIRPRLPVRICYRAGRILRLEVGH